MTSLRDLLVRATSASGPLGVVSGVVLTLVVVFTQVLFGLGRWVWPTPASHLDVVRWYKSVFELLPMVAGVAILAALFALTLAGLRQRRDGSGLAVGVILAATVLLVALLPTIVEAYALDTRIADDAWVQGRVEVWRGLFIVGVALVVLTWAQRWPELSLGAVPAILVGAAILAIAPFSSPETPASDPVPTPRHPVALREVNLLGADCPAVGSVSVVIVTPKLNDNGDAVGTETHRHLAKLEAARDCAAQPSRHGGSVADLTLAFSRGEDDASLTELLGELSTRGVIVYVAPANESTPAPSAVAGSE